MRYYIADNHFFHRALNENMDKRGFQDVDEMNAYMIKQWNSRVTKRDEVVIVGDLSWGTGAQTQEVVDQLNGHLYLIKGNHDRFLKDKNFDASRFIWIKDYAELNENKRKVVICHYPIACYNGQYRRNELGEPKTFMMHGHIHKTQDQQILDYFQEYVQNQDHAAIGGGMEKIPCQFINCFCMYSDYVPLTLDEWIQVTKERKSRVY